MEKAMSKMNININNLKKQQGVSKLGLLVMFFLVAVFLTAGLKVVPLYIDHNLIVGICDKLIETGEAENMTITDIRLRVSRTLRINNVRDFDLNSITLRRENSSDSRVWGAVPEKDIVGKAVAVWMHKEPGLNLPTFSRNQLIN